MSDGQSDVPFWVQPPYILLTDVLQLDKVQPWNVNVGRLVSEFLREMRQMGDIDFRVSGNALYSASVIFMRKTRELVQMGVLPQEEEEDEEELEIPLIRPPFRLTNRRVTLQELIIAMDRVLSRGPRRRAPPKKRRTRSPLGPLSFAVDSQRADAEETVLQVYSDLREMVGIGKTVRFFDVIMSSTRREIVRVFFALLHLYSRSFVDIWMDEEDVIWIRLLDPPSDEQGKDELAAVARE